jgi:hypothetical protein
MASTSIRTGGCLCGAVRFEVSIPDTTFNICHCAMCRKWCGGPFQAVHSEGDATFTEDSGLTWYRSSDWGERGFCAKCGTSLFWRFADKAHPFLGLAVEALDDADDLTLDRHIFIDAKPARYDFKDDRPRMTEAEFLAELGIAPPD